MTQNDCNCADPVQPSGCTPLNSPFDCKIFMYLGEYYDSSLKTPIGVLDQIYIANKPDPDNSSTWIIDNYYIDDLIKSGILPDPNSSSPDPNAFRKFKLRENELLSTLTYESWLFWLADYTVAKNIKAPADITNDSPFGLRIAKVLKIEIDKWFERSSVLIKALEKTNPDSAGAFGNKTFIAPTTPSMTQEERNITFSKLEQCYNWLRNIYDTYYGKKYLVKIGNKPPADLNQPDDFRGICAKEEDGSYPKISIDTGKYYVQGDGSGQKIFLSDEISDSGGFPEQNTDSVIGLKKLDPFLYDDGKINCFVKYGKIIDSGSTYLYDRYGVKWYLDFTALNPDNFYIDTIGTSSYLYLKSSVDSKIYFINTDILKNVPGVEPHIIYDDELQGQWALITLNEQVPLSISSPLDFAAAKKILEAVVLLATSQLKNVLRDWLKIIPNKPESKNFGSINNMSQLNLLNCQRISINPTAVAIPMKSNISSYGPYYYTNIGADGSGGTKTSKQDLLSPWNFFSYRDAINDTFGNAINKAYDEMNCLGAKLAYEPTKALLRLEKGRATVAGLPVYNLGHNVDNLTNGPTLLTDISVDYGSSGFSTTYNFQTYTPRFGQTEKYILDAWTDSIKTNQLINQSLREERARSSIIGKELQKNIGSKNKTTTGNLGPIYNTKSTPNRLLISGYKLYTNGQDLDDSNDFEYPSPGGNAPVQPEDPCNDPPPISGVVPPSGTNADRIYSFAETHEAYQALYVQSTYRQLSIMSIDGLYLPVSLRGDRSTYDSSPIVGTGENSGRIARFAMRAENNGSFVEWENSDDVNYQSYAPGIPNPSKTRDEIPPFKIIGVDATKSYSLPINQQYLNPMLSSTLINMWDERKNDTTQGFVINSIAFGDNFDQYQLTHNNTPDNEDTDDETIRQEQDNFRFSAMRGPLVLQGWGYDTTGKPIPNMADAPKKAELGKFRKDGLTDKFMKDWIANPRTWPVGPIDLRFDRERGVWVCPSPNKIIVARLKESLQPYNKAKAELINPEAGGIKFYEHYNISGPNGENVKLSMESTSIVVYDFLGIKLCPNDIIYAYYDDNRYIVLESSRAYKNNPEEECTVQCTPTTTTPTTTTPTTPTPCWCDLDCLKTLDGYQEGAKQILGQESGCLKWFDVTECPPTGSSQSQAMSQINNIIKVLPTSDIKIQGARYNPRTS